jgi:integrase
MKDGKRSEIGLGAYSSGTLDSKDKVTLGEARLKAAAIRAQVKGGGDPLTKKRAAKAGRLEAQDRTFAKVAVLAHGLRRFKTEQLKARWIGRLERFAFPYFGDVPVHKVDGPMVIEALEPIWSEKPETARRVRQLVAAVLKHAHSRQWRGPVPALVDLVKDGLPAHATGAVHRPAVDYLDAPAVIAKLRAEKQTIGRLALLFTAYTAVRSGETRLATWSEIDLENAKWTIPADRMKMEREHVVPLSPQALAILETVSVLRTMDANNEGDPAALVFPGERKGRPISDMTMAKAHKLAAPGTVPHGWRSTFRDWAAEATDHPSDVCEAALAHLIGNATTRSYQRGTMFEKRRALMNDWSAYVMPKSAYESETLVDVVDQDSAA